MEHIVQEGINIKKNSNLEAFLKTSLKRYQNKKTFRAKVSTWLLTAQSYLFSTLWRQVFSSFLRQAGANRLYKVELNILVLLSLTHFYQTRDLF